MAGHLRDTATGEAAHDDTPPDKAMSDEAAPDGALSDGAVPDGTARDMDRPRRRGRRPAGSDTRGQILAAARAELAQRGYDGATVRAVARRAGVDPALVRHYFEDKADLFAAAMVPVGTDPAQVVSALLEGGLDGLGERLAREVLDVWEDQHGERFRALFGALGSSEPHLQAMAQFLGRQVFARVAAALPPQDAELRMALVASHVAGVLVTRHVMRLPEIARLGTAELATLVGPALQAYLTGPLPGLPGSEPQQPEPLVLPHPGESLAPTVGEEHYSSHGE